MQEFGGNWWKSACVHELGGNRRVCMNSSEIGLVCMNSAGVFGLVCINSAGVFGLVCMNSVEIGVCA